MILFSMKVKVYFTRGNSLLYRSIRHGENISWSGSFPTSVLGIEPRISVWFATALPTALLRRHPIDRKSWTFHTYNFLWPKNVKAWHTPGCSAVTQPRPSGHHDVIDLHGSRPPHATFLQLNICYIVWHVGNVENSQKLCKEIIMAVIKLYKMCQLFESMYL